MDVIDQVVSVFSGTQGFLDDLPVAEVRKFETALLTHMHAVHQPLLDKIRSTGKLDDEGLAALKDAVGKFKAGFKPAAAAPAAAPPAGKS
jgi:F-type H+-transporting ATPase subunit alpha